MEQPDMLHLECSAKASKWKSWWGHQFMKNKIKLQFMVVPELLKELAYVPNPIRVKIIDPEAIFLTGLLGESGRKLVKAGVEFYFTKELAEKLIKKNIAVEVK